jgi:hypothetical protein
VAATLHRCTDKVAEVMAVMGMGILLATVTDLVVVALDFAKVFISLKDSMFLVNELCRPF